jgi:importin subunit alpha-1
VSNLGVQVSKALPVVSQLIFSKDEEIVTDACWAVAYLCDEKNGENQRIQAVLQSGMTRRIVDLLMHKNTNVKTPALRAIGNLVTGDDLQTQVVLNASVLPCMLNLLVYPNKNIRKEACWAISNITAGNADQNQMVIEASIVPVLIDIMTKAEFDVKKEAVWAMSNITSAGRNSQIRYLVDKGAIKALCDFLDCDDNKVITAALLGWIKR